MHRLPEARGGTGAREDCRSDRPRPIVRPIDGLATAPRPPQVVRLEGSDGLHRIRAGGYRIIHTVEDATRTVLIAATGHRREVYRR